MGAVGGSMWVDAPPGRFRACVEVPAGVSRPHSLRQVLEGRQ